MKPLCPRHKRLKREGRLQAAKYWLPKYDGKNIVKGYSKHFGVNIICAVLELRMLGHDISEYYLEQLKDREIQQQQSKERKKRMKEQRHQDDVLEYSDETFYFIAGYTSNDVSYGLTWEEMEHDNEALNGHSYSEELPF